MKSKFNKNNDLNFFKSRFNKITAWLVAVIIASMLLNYLLSNISPNSSNNNSSISDANNVENITNGEVSNNSKMGICMNRNMNNIDIKRCQSAKGQFANECLNMSHDLLMQCLDGL